MMNRTFANAAWAFGIIATFLTLVGAGCLLAKWAWVMLV